MRIETSNIQLNSNSVELQNKQVTEMINVWEDKKDPEFPEDIDIITLSEESLSGYQKNIEVPETDNEGEVKFELSALDQNKIMLLEKFMETLTGKKTNLRFVKKLSFKKAKAPQVPKEKVADVKEKVAEAHESKRLGWGIDYHYSESHYESEKMEFNAKGTIETQDGQKIDINLQLSMSREYASNLEIDFKAGDALLDPLVINFDGTGVSLTEEKFAFDLDADGKDDQVSFVNQGSGMLAVDLNNDNKVNDGSELFGPTTGKGFAELSQYDLDKNGWIDENDAVYDKLKLWVKDQDNNDYLFSLSEKNIGAIYLGNADSSFSIKDSNNNLQGQIKASGIYLKENGEAGTVHQIDLAL